MCVCVFPWPCPCPLARCSGCSGCSCCHTRCARASTSLRAFMWSWLLLQIALQMPMLPLEGPKHYSSWMEQPMGRPLTTSPRIRDPSTAVSSFVASGSRRRWYNHSLGQSRDPARWGTLAPKDYLAKQLRVGLEGVRPFKRSTRQTVTQSDAKAHAARLAKSATSTSTTTRPRLDLNAMD